MTSGPCATCRHRDETCPTGDLLCRYRVKTGTDPVTGKDLFEGLRGIQPSASGKVWCKTVRFRHGDPIDCHHWDGPFEPSPASRRYRFCARLYHLFRLGWDQGWRVAI